MCAGQTPKWWATAVSGSRTPLIRLFAATSADAVAATGLLAAPAHADVLEVSEDGPRWVAGVLADAALAAEAQAAADAEAAPVPDDTVPENVAAPAWAGRFT